MQDEVLYKELYFKTAEKYFDTGKTPLSASPKNLPEIRPPSHLDLSTTLPSFSSLYREFSYTPAKMDANIFLHNAIFSRICRKV